VTTGTDEAATAPENPRPFANTFQHL